MFVLIVLFFVTFVCFYNFYWKRRNLPPGPIPWPFFGNTLDIMKYEPGYEAFNKWSKEYGPIHTIWLGERPMVAISDFDLIMETFVKDPDSCIDRPKNVALQKLARQGPYGVVFTDGELWREQRRFTLHVFRDFGVGKNVMQDRVLSEISALLEKVNNDQKSGLSSINLASYIDIAVGSIINNILFGYRFEGISEKEFYELKKLVTGFIKCSGNPWVNILRKHFQYAQYLPIFRKYYLLFDHCSQKLREFFKRQVEEHKKNADHDSEPTDYVEVFLREKAKREKDGDISPNYSMEQLLGVLLDLWVAGQETTSNTLAWGVSYLMQEPGVQARMQQELDQFIGSDRLVTMDDKPNLHYTNAVVNEIQRIANLVPINLQHSTSRDVNIKGYSIPKGVTIIPHISVVLYDEKIFPNPQKFDPTRFLDSNGKLKKVDELIPFSVGKRQCLGEGLARMELFLFTANIFNQFRINVVPQSLPNMKRIAGATVGPLPFVCKVEKRY